MNLEAWLDQDRRRVPSERHRSYGDGWTVDDAQHWTVRWVAATGELYTTGPSDEVDVVGVFTEATATSIVAGWETDQGQPGSLYRLRVAADRATEALASEADRGQDRPSGARYRLEGNDGTWWEMGWNRRLATFYAQRFRSAAGPDGPHRMLTWHGNVDGDLRDVSDLEQAVGRRLDSETAAELSIDKSYFPNPGRPPFLSWADELEAEETQEQTMAKTLLYEQWIEADHRRAVPHLDYGIHWTGAEPNEPDDRRRLSWVPDTGELYTVDAADRVEVLGVVETRDQVDITLSGWTIRSLEPGSIAWARRAVRAVGQTVDGDDSRPLKGPAPSIEPPQPTEPEPLSQDAGPELDL
jgi:2'-5' RNA ligase